MKAVLCTHFGGPDDLALTDIAETAPAPHEARVRVKAAALNFFDTLIIAGKYQLKPPFPFSPAAEFSGIVDAVGANVTAVAVGDRVVASMGFGAARESVTIPAEKLVKLPDGLDFERAAGLIITYGTTLHALKDRADLKPAETLAVLGASGGVGIAAVELGKLMGARVVACASSDEKLAFARAHGADETVNYAQQDLRDALRRSTSDKGPDVIYDPVGGAYAEAALRAIAWQGRYLVVGFAAGEIPKLPLNLVLLKGCDIRGVFWGSWTDRNPAGHRANVLQLMQWCLDGKLSGHVHATYPLEKTAEALKVLADRKAMGKVILTP